MLIENIVVIKKKGLKRSRYTYIEERRWLGRMLKEISWTPLVGLAEDGP